MISLTEDDNGNTSVSEGFNQNYQGFLQSRRSNVTRVVYESGISVILGDTKPDAFLEYARINPKGAETKIISWLFKFRDSPGRYRKKPSGSTFRAYLASLKSYLEFCDVSLNWKRIIQVTPQARKASKKRGYLAEEIRPLYDFLDPREKFAVLFYSSTGARAAAIGDPKPLTVGDIERLDVEILGKKITIGHVKIYSEANEEYDGYLTDEALDGLDTYLNYRRTFGETITEDSPLFRAEIDLREAKKDAAKKEKKLKVRPATVKSVQTQIQRGLVAVGLEKRSFKMIHGFRFRFKTILENSNMKSIYIEKLLGHTSSGDDPDNYLKADYKTLGAEFAKYQSLLYVGEGRTAKIKIAELETEKDEKIASLQSQIDKLNTALSKILERGEEELANKKDPNLK